MVSDADSSAGGGGMTPERRAALIDDCESEIEIINRRLGRWPIGTFSATALQSQLQRQQIALASLQAVPVGEMVKFTDRVTGEVSEWRLSKNICGNTQGFQYRTETKPIFDAPPVCLAEMEQDGLPIEAAICRFVTQHYSVYQGSYLCGKCAEITCYLLSMAGKPFEKMTCQVNGVGHILVKSGDYYIDPSIRQFGDYPELSSTRYPIAGVELTPAHTALSTEEVRQRPLRYMNRYTGVCVTLEQQPDAATDTAVYIPLIACPASAVNGGG